MPEAFFRVLILRAGAVRLAVKAEREKKKAQRSGICPRRK
jgi:hypothetical protein